MTNKKPEHGEIRINGDHQQEWVAIDENSGYWIERRIKTTFNKENIVPSQCPVCNFPMAGRYDSKTYFKYDCCERCYIQFIEGQPNWKNNWPPSGSRFELYLKKKRKK